MESAFALARTARRRASSANGSGRGEPAAPGTTATLLSALIAAFPNAANLSARSTAAAPYPTLRRAKQATHRAPPRSASSSGGVTRMNLVDRIKGIVVEPRNEWPKIAAEPATVQSLYTGWIMILAAVAPIAVL